MFGIGTMGRRRTAFRSKIVCGYPTVVAGQRGRAAIAAQNSFAGAGIHRGDRVPCSRLCGPAHSQSSFTNESAFGPLVAATPGPERPLHLSGILNVSRGGCSQTDVADGP